MKPINASRHARRLPCAGLLLALAGVASAQTAPAQAPQAQQAHAAARAQDDFYRYANGQWLQSTPIPPERARIGAFLTLRENTSAQLRVLIEEAAAGGRDGNARKIGDLYAAFMDQASRDKLGVEPIRAELARIDAIADKRELAPLFARFTRLGVDGPLAVRINQDARDSTRYVPTLVQGGLGMPDRDYYLQDTARFKEVRSRYVAHLSRLLALAGEQRPDADAAAIIALETRLAEAQWSRVDSRDRLKTYNRVDIGNLPAVAAQLDWQGFLAAAGLEGRTPDVVVHQPSYVAGLGRALDALPLDDWKAYAKARLIVAYAPLLGRAFVDERFSFAGTVLQGTSANLPQWERGVAQVSESLGQALGQLYVQRHFPPQHKARVEQLVANLTTAYRQSIDTLPWMGPETRRQAQDKLAAISLKIAYPKRWIDYDTLDIQRGDLVGNVMRARRFEQARQVARLGKPVDRDDWFTTPQTVNAYYNASRNEIVFPAAILQPPFFDATGDDAANYGAIGAVIGHEISHGFDDQGSRYDAQGNLRDWWTAEDRARFDARTQALVAQYARFEPVPGYHVNGRQTLGENIADNSGLAIAHKAWRLSLDGKPPAVIDGLSGEQRFFMGYARIWRIKWREEALIEALKADVHSPGEFRVNGVLPNLPGFYDAFGVKPGDAMYLPPQQRVSIW
jgi:predicted metalloendopeptidase